MSNNVFFEYNNDEVFMTKEERRTEMMDSDPGDATGYLHHEYRDTGDEWLDHHNREARNYAISSYYSIKRSYKHDIDIIFRNRDFGKLVELISEVNYFIIHDHNAWGDYLQKRFFRWIEKAKLVYRIHDE